MAEKVIVMHDPSIHREIRDLRRKTKRLGIITFALCAYLLVRNIRIVKAGSEDASEETKEGT